MFTDPSGWTEAPWQRPFFIVTTFTSFGTAALFATRAALSASHNVRSVGTIEAPEEHSGFQLGWQERIALILFGVGLLAAGYFVTAHVQLGWEM